MHDVQFYLCTHLDTTVQKFEVSHFFYFLKKEEITI